MVTAILKLFSSDHGNNLYKIVTISGIEAVVTFCGQLYSWLNYHILIQLCNRLLEGIYLERK